MIEQVVAALFMKSALLNQVASKEGGTDSGETDTTEAESARANSGKQNRTNQTGSPG